MSKPTHLTCQEFVELVTDYLEGGLSPEDRARFESHLPLCRGCAEYLAQMRETIRTTGQLREESLDPLTREQLLSLFSDWKRTAQ